MKLTNILSLCDGISCGQNALRRSGIDFDNYFASEIDKFAIKITQHHFPETIQLGDVVNIDVSILPKIDILIAGTPCQSFSFSGKKKGMITKDNIEITDISQYLKLKEEGFVFEGQSYLFWEFVRILKETKPKYFLLENVVMLKKWEDIISQTLGIEPILINSNLLSAQNRKRLYWTNILGIQQPEDKGIMFTDISDDDTDLDNHRLNDIPYELFKTKNYYKYDYSGKQYWSQAHRIYYRNGKIATLTTTLCPKVESSKEGYYRKLTINEIERLQTLPDGYTQLPGISFSKSIHAIGNGWTVDVISHILNHIKN